MLRYNLRKINRQRIILRYRQKERLKIKQKGHNYPVNIEKAKKRKPGNKFPFLL